MPNMGERGGEHVTFDVLTAPWYEQHANYQCKCGKVLWTVYDLIVSCPYCRTMVIVQKDQHGKVTATEWRYRARD